MTPNERIRIPCPRCRSNNFPGKTNCWQCGSSLPPPEALSAPTAAHTPQPQFAQAPQRFAPDAPRRSWVPIAAVVGIIAVILIGIVVMRPKSKAVGPESALQDQIAALKAQQEKMMGAGPPSISNPASLDPDSLEGRAQRELQRLQKKAGVGGPPTDANGNVHLQGGGVISREEWEKARNSVSGYKPP